MHRVAITGLGVISCLGRSTAVIGDALRAGRSGVGVDPERVARGFRSPLTGMITDFDAAEYLSRKQRKTMPDFAMHAYVATLDALAMAGLADADIRNDQTGLVFGCDSSAVAAVEQVATLARTHETRMIGSGYVFQSLTSTVTMNLNTLLGTQGASWSVSAACASGGQAIGQAFDLIALGRQERVIAGGAQEISWQSMCSFDALGAFSTRVAEPHAASRPFSADRDGLVPGGGAAALVLERYDLARRRGARILGEVLGFGFSSDGDHISVPAVGPPQAAMRMALAQAGLKATDVDYVCAHATSTLAGDAAEAANIAAVFPDRTPWVSSLKSMTGHELWMAGASQVAYTAIMAEQGFIARNANFTGPDEHSARLRIAVDTVPEPPRIAMCNCSGFGGTNSSLLIGFAP